MTALVAMEHADMDEVVTITASDVALSADSQVCGLAEGDQIQMSELFHALLVYSANDAAMAIARTVGDGSVDTFVQMMNETAQSLGMTGTHFVNPHGLHDDDHYTTVYDLYLIFQKAIQDETFYHLISTSSYTTNYTGADGSAKTQDWSSTNQYKTGESKLPDGFTLVGSKTGTTGEAGFCLVLLTDNTGGQPVISIVLKADCKSNLYLMMNEILARMWYRH